jgi:hypothetical protein
MTVRGTTRWEHARVMKRVINRDTEDRNYCCDPRCDDKRSYALYTHIQCLHDTRQGCRAADEMSIRHGGGTVHQRFAFCSERHMERFIWSQGWRAAYMIENYGRAGGDLPTGYRGLT